MKNGDNYKRRRKDTFSDDEGSCSTDHEPKKKDLDGIITSLLLLEEQEKRDHDEQNEASCEEKSILELNHKRKTRTMFEFYTNIQDYYSEIEENDRMKRKKSRAMAASVVAAAAVSQTESQLPSQQNKQSGSGQQRRLWVKDRSKAWWDECNRPDYPDEEFKKAFRMSKSTFELICEELNSVIAKEDTTLRNAIPVKQRVAVCIWRLATGEPLRLVSKRFGLGISTCHKLVLEVCSAIRSVLMPKYLHWPDEDSLRKIKEEFEGISGIPNVVGSMYTTHIPIIAPKISVAAYFNKRHTERNQKTSYTITVQGVVDPRGVFTDVCIGWPGSMNDDQVLEKSALFQRANGGLLKGVWIVGNSGYPLMDWVLVPYTQQNLTWTQHAFNEKIGEIQKIAKESFGRLKGRWGCLQKRTEVKLQDLPVVLGACCVLHNICEMRDEGIDPDLEFELVDDEMVPEVAQFWAASACSCGVLIFLSIVTWCAANNKNTRFSCSVWDAKFSLSCVILYSVVCCVSLATISHTGFNTALKLLWLLCHGFAAVKLIQHLVYTFPFCASIGEALLVTSGLVLYFGDMLAISKVCRLLIPPELVSIRYGIKRSEIGIIIQGALLGLLIFSALFKFLVQLREYFGGAKDSESRKIKEIERSLIFFTSLGFIMIAIAPSWMMIVLDFDVHPVLWIFRFIFSEPFKRLSLCIYWLALIYASVLRFYNISKNSKIERILLRKYYHLLAVSMFLPALLYQPKFLDLAFGAALALFLVLEIIRVWRIWPLGELVHQFMSAFTDHRDSDLFIVSHFSLLLGCALPIWMSSGFNDRPLTPFAGILSLGIGDTIASMVGHKYGVLRWSKTGKKTIEGTAAGITSVLAACSVLVPLLASTGYILTQHWFPLLIAVTTSGLLEAYTTQLDNAFIPLVFYSLLCL